MQSILETTFRNVVATSFYDGAESGVAVYESGEAISFFALGDSDCRLLRAFELKVVVGNWKSRVEATYRSEGADYSRRFLLVSKDSPASLALEHDLSRADSSGSYVGIGTPYLEDLQTAAITATELQTLRDSAKSANAFTAVAEVVRQSNAAH